jgi:branched-chain amino acid transport system substrate-binding protein
MWRVVNRFATWADSTMDFILDAQDSGEIDIKKIGIVTVSASPGPELGAVLEARAKAAGLETFMISYDPAETRDFSNIVASLRDANPDLITGLSYPGDSILFAEAVTLQEWQPKEGYVWIAGGQYLNSFRTILGERTINWMDASYGGPITGCAATEAFAQKYLDRFGEPLVGLALAGPATIQVIANALEVSGSSDADAFKEAMATLEVAPCSGLYTMAGSVKFDAKGDNVAWVPTIIQHEGDLNQVAVWPQDVAARPAIWPARP